MKIALSVYGLRYFVSVLWHETSAVLVSDTGTVPLIATTDNNNFYLHCLISGTCTAQS